MNLGDLDSIGPIFWSEAEQAYYFINGKGAFEQYQNSSATLDYTTYAAKLTQSGTSAPTATEYANTSGATFELARTSAGIYTLTASSAIFIKGTFEWFFGNCSNAAITVISLTVTSTTVLTLQTNELITPADFNGDIMLELNFYYNP